MDKQFFGSAIMLAGGMSSRMGFDKQELPFVAENIEMLCGYFDDVIISSSRPELYEGFPVRVCEDAFHGNGPLSGIHAGLKLARSKYCYVIACDMPVISFEYISYVKEKIMDLGMPEICIAKRDSGRIESMNGFYASSLWRKAEKCLKEGRFSVKNLWAAADSVFYITESELKPFLLKSDIFKNINTPEELCSACMGRRQMI